MLLVDSTAAELNDKLLTHCPVDCQHQSTSNPQALPYAAPSRKHAAKHEGGTCSAMWYALPLLRVLIHLIAVTYFSETRRGVVSAHPASLNHRRLHRTLPDRVCKNENGLVLCVAMWCGALVSPSVQDLVTCRVGLISSAQRALHTFSQRTQLPVILSTLLAT